MHLLFDVEGEVHEEDVAAGMSLVDATRSVHCMVVYDLEAPEDPIHTFGPGEIEGGLRLLSKAAVVYGHNITDYDLPVLKKLYGWVPTGDVLCTKCASRVVYPGSELKFRDFGFAKRNPNFPRALIGWHSLEAWGWRLGIHKAGYTGGFERYTPEMLDYCEQDVLVNLALLKHLQKKGFPDSVFITESAVATILYRQHRYGVGFDKERAIELMLQLTKRRDELTAELQQTFRPWWVKNGAEVVPKRSAISKKYKPGHEKYRNVREGCAYQKIKLIDFNPASGEHIADRLQKVFGWKPMEFTDEGKPKTEEKILDDLPYAPAAPLSEYQKVKKILGYISEGNNAWLKLERNGRIHGRVNATGTVTNRMSQVQPNTAQVPKVGKYMGKECRGLFVAPGARVLVGCDASGLQLRMLAHYVARYDGGAFARELEKENADPHTYMMAGTGILSRDDQKTFTYAFLFGAGDTKLGTIIISSLVRLRDRGEYDGKVPALRHAAKVGRRAKNGLAQLLNAGGLDDNLKAAARRKYLVSLDGRRIPVLSDHRALNTLLMGGEAVVMKHALLRADERLSARWLAGDDYEFVLNVHDEWQVETWKELAEEVGQTLAQAITDTGKNLGLRVRLDGEYKVGKTWAETH